MIVVLNGTPRSGKSSIVTELQSVLEGVWMNLGVDVSRRMTPPSAEEPYGTDRALVERWEREVHRRWAYDVEVDTSVSSPDACAVAIGARLAVDPPPSAFARLATFLA